VARAFFEIARRYAQARRAPCPPACCVAAMPSPAISSSLLLLLIAYIHARLHGDTEAGVLFSQEVSTRLFDRYGMLVVVTFSITALTPERLLSVAAMEDATAAMVTWYS